VNLKQRTFSAGRWTTISALVRSGLQVLQIAVLARLLSPADFGLMAITVSLVAVLSLFTDIGLSRAIIHFETVPEDAMISLFWLNLLAGLGLSTLFAASSPLLSKIFKLDGLESVLLTISPIFILSAIGQQLCALAEKEFRFATLAINEIVAGSLGFVVAIIVALNGGGVYALLAGVLTNSIANSALAWLRLSTGRWLRWHFDFSETKRFLNFGSYLVGEGFLNAVIRQSDIFVGGFSVNPTALGIYSVPRDLSLRISMIVNPIITRVGFPVMSRLQEDMKALKSVYLQTLRMTASVNFPAYIALGLFADEVVALLYGPHWRGAAIYLRLLAVWGLLRSTGNPVGSLLHAVGHVRRAFWWNACLVLLLPLIYLIAAYHWQLMGLTIALIVVHVGLLVPSWYFLVRPTCGATLSEYLKQLLIPLLISLLSVGTAWFITRDIPHGTLRLAIGGLIGSTIYVGLSSQYNRQWFNAMWRLINLPEKTTDAGHA
jgi:O-antigen/teichoic acid export membrane protein